jgi:hypothetical protein
MKLLETFLLALTDAQFDKVLIMIGDGCSAISEGIKVLWGIASPLARHGPTVSALAAQLQLTDEQVDAMFLQAAAIIV